MSIRLRTTAPTARSGIKRTTMLGGLIALSCLISPETIVAAVIPSLPAATVSSPSSCTPPAGIIDDCSDEMNRLIISTAGCLIGTIGFFKATKTMKGIAKGIKNGGSPKAIIFGAIGAFFCTDVYHSYWNWRDCDNGLQDGGFLDSGLDPLTVMYEKNLDLADAFEDLAAEMERGGS